MENAMELKFQKEADHVFHRSLRDMNPDFSQQEWDFFQSGFSYKCLKPKEMFMEAGKENKVLGFVTLGLIRGFYVNERGDDITIIFIRENEWVTDYPSLLMGKPSRYHFECLEETMVTIVPYVHIQEGYQRFAGFERNGRLIAEAVLKGQQVRIESFQFDSARQRYLDFATQCPELLNRVSLTHLSSYLGIERPSLSRIRKQIAGL
jgi:CRP/FNR family transcriptional regulator, anaerobic regulatory protein